LTLIVAFGLTLASVGCAQPDQTASLIPSQGHVQLPSLAPVVQAVIPAVVHVSAVQTSSMTRAGEEYAPGVRPSKHQSADRGLPPAALDKMIERFFGVPDLPVKSTGSGFIIDPEGFIVTEDHVVENAEKVTVTFQDGQRHPAGIIGRDPKTELALLKIDVNHPLPMSAGATAIPRGLAIGC